MRKFASVVKGGKFMFPEVFVSNQSETSDSEHTEYQRLKWHSRRGMLELDVLLMPFVEKRYPSLSRENQLRYQKLLQCEDPELFQWFMRHSTPSDSDLLTIVALILEDARPH